MSWLKSSQLILDVVTVDPCNSSSEFAAEIPVNLAESCKIKKFQPFVDKLVKINFVKLSIPFAQRFNQLRTEFLAHLLNLDSKFLREHIFCSPDLGGVGFTKSKVLSKAALIGSGKNFVFEFSSRFSPDLALLSSNCSPFLLALEHEINTLPLDVWMKCFPIEVQEIPVKN
ncbi:hypothetical protein RCL1_002110 [Eukaryota sp. TZLM3-RCL]